MMQIYNIYMKIHSNKINYAFHFIEISLQEKSYLKTNF